MGSDQANQMEKDPWANISPNQASVYGILIRRFLVSVAMMNVVLHVIICWVNPTHVGSTIVLLFGFSLQTEE